MGREDSEELGDVRERMEEGRRGRGGEGGYEHLEFLPYLCIKNETMAPLHVTTLTVKGELPKYEITII